MKCGRERRRIRLIVSVVGAVAILMVWRTIGGPFGLSLQGPPLGVDAHAGTPAMDARARSGFQAGGDRPGASFLTGQRQAGPAPQTAQAPAGTSDAPGRLQGVIDGRVNPDAISDATAAAMLLPMLAPSPTGAEGHERRRRIMLRDAGFDEHDLHVLQEVLAPLNGQIDEWRRQANAAHDATNKGSATGDAAAPRPEPAGLERPSAQTAAAFARLQRELSAEGINRLRQQLAYIKSNTTVYPVMTGASGRSR